MPERLPLVFLGGMPRSGTTLLARMVSAHPEVAGLGETHVLPALMGFRRTLLNVLQRTQTGEAIRDIERIDALLEQLLRDLWVPLVPEGRSVLAEKTPQNVLAIAGALKAMPGSRAVVTTRDPRGVIASLMGVRERLAQQGKDQSPATRNLTSAIREMSEMARALVRLAEDERVHVVRYEDLAARPEPAMRGICDFLGLEFSDRSLNLVEVYGSSTQPDGAWYTKESLHRNPEATRLHAWGERLSPVDEHLVRRFLPHPLLYPPDAPPCPPLTPAQRAELAARVRSEQVRRRTNRHLTTLTKKV